MAPLLRPKSKGEEGGRSPEGHLPAFEITEAQLHDISILPHMYPEGERDRLFPVIDAAEAIPDSEDWLPCEKGSTTME